MCGGIAILSRRSLWRSPAKGLAQDKPVTIRLGNTTTSGEDQMWLMKARPDLTPNQGKAYTLETYPFRGGDLRLRAFQAGQVDAVVTTGTGALTAAVKGVPLVIVAALSEEDNAHYSTPYVVMDASPIRSVKDLKGKTIGLNGLREALRAWRAPRPARCGTRSRPRRQMGRRAAAEHGRGAAHRQGRHREPAAAVLCGGSRARRHPHAVHPAHRDRLQG